MKKVIGYCIFFLTFFLVVYSFREEIGNFIYKNFVLEDIQISEFEPNKYYRPVDYSYVQITDDFIAKDEQHLLNIYYTIVNAGADTFTFACDNEYKECLNDVGDLSNNQSVLSNINSFVHPFNGFSSVETTYDSLGRVEIKVNKAYSAGEIKLVEEKVQSIIDTKLKGITDQEAIIKKLHDYIIETTKYDTDRSDYNIVKYKSDLAYGPLLEGYGLCGGYTDTMALFLDYYNIPNFKVISETHVWNAVYINDEWRHLDLTWDDPVTTSGKDLIEYKFFLIDTISLFNIEKEEHNFDINVFKELE